VLYEYNFAVHFNLRRYTKVVFDTPDRFYKPRHPAAAAEEGAAGAGGAGGAGGRAAAEERGKRHDTTLVERRTLRRLMPDAGAVLRNLFRTMVRRCRLTLSNPFLKRLELSA